MVTVGVVKDRCLEMAGPKSGIMDIILGKAVARALGWRVQGKFSTAELLSQSHKHQNLGKTNAKTTIFLNGCLKDNKKLLVLKRKKIRQGV